MSGRTTYRQKCRHEVPAYNASMDPHPERLRAAQRRRRHIIKNSGATQHHDQLTGRFEHNGDTQVIFWNQGDKTLYLAEIPANPQQSPWKYKAIYKAGVEEEKHGSYVEGLAKADVDGDGNMDILYKPSNLNTPRVDIWLQNGTGTSSR